VPAADITVIDGNQVEKRIPMEEARKDAGLKRIAVFDTTVARTHLVDENPLGFNPVGFDVFPELGRIYGELAKRLTAEIDRRNRAATANPAGHGGIAPDGRGNSGGRGRYRGHLRGHGFWSFIRATG
jgi:hypothetical protein